MSATGALDKADGVTARAANLSLAQPLRPQRMRVPGFAYLTVAPTLLVVAIVVGGPLVYSFYLSLHRTNPITKKWLFVGFGNYAAAIGNADFWAAIGRTVYFASFTLVGARRRQASQRFWSRPGKPSRRWVLVREGKQRRARLDPAGRF